MNSRAAAMLEMLQERGFSPLAFDLAMTGDQELTEPFFAEAGSRSQETFFATVGREDVEAFVVFPMRGTPMQQEDMTITIRYYCLLFPSDEEESIIVRRVASEEPEFVSDGETSLFFTGDEWTCDLEGCIDSVDRRLRKGYEPVELDMFMLHRALEASQGCKPR